ncbi:TetR/AcrR family transcriptional regulator [Altererythrobacter sp. BO-6]|uniref:TetR/AcrR family transcriptional regulator n=1 Tax=Altererythrobacter sp. BO-6 TaxID=2604537 RepID=UPI0013E1B5AF|nr:TetR/AcrR family transcriptional regulator [Altererythrobacter sp. BO-6]QIG53793.1 TetR/AcrR family transcriptional regulator [Altererythrobacter sp. BO-6]
MGQASNPARTRRKRAGRPPAAENVDRRKAILDTSIELFAKDGFSRVELRDIAAQAGVTVSLIRHYFGSKDELIDEATSKVGDRLEAVYEKILTDIEAHNVEELLDLLYQRNERYLVPEYNLLFFLKQMAVELPEKSFPVFRKHFSLMQAQLSGLEAIGQIQPGVNMVWLTFMLISIQFGPIFLERQIEDFLGISPRNPEATRMRNQSNARAVKYGIMPRDTGQN